ncbi:flagellar protein FlaG [Bacillus sp. FJAT-50079]|nr:flagellar protein FlaG [Bacillus sp. FJAT-50079]
MVGDFSSTSVVGTSSNKMETTYITNEAISSKEHLQPDIIPSKQQVEKIVDGLNDFLKATTHTNLKFEFHDKLNEYYVTIVDEVTKEIVKEIPPKKMLDMFAAMTEFLGLMVDKKI